MQESRLMSIRRTAQKIYLDILHEDPNIFLPFILTISETACRSFNVSRFCQQHKKEDRIRLNVKAKNILESIATRHNIRLEPNYKILENFLFPQPKPVTRADSNEYWAYSAASLKAAHNFFGDRIFNAIESSPIRMREQSHPTTESVRMKFPQEDFQDVNLMLDVGLDNKLISDLFPRASERLFPLLQAHPSDGHPVLTTRCIAMPECLDNAYFTLLGASLSGVSSIFCPDICNAIGKSKLRIWEKDNLLHETTDCVIMEVYRDQPQHCTLRLRLAFVESFEIMNNLFAPGA
ncbi:hypothetical protein ACJ73_01623 [Blastomyces percursus]|uniref:Uncharacterized protein n=1 Tax=Blastomyces percursus TaxID=1658174 RepID=A0A1J9RH90_9EURO|nr:hypothetical protein ACJ73_01623 [Blastomyces percursus]